MLVVIGSENRYLGANLDRLVMKVGLRRIRTNKIERILKELKRPERLAVIDMEWSAVQEPGELRRMVNVGRIVANVVVCICPNQDEDLKKLGRSVLPAEVFIRYELELGFTDFLKEQALKKRDD